MTWVYFRWSVVPFYHLITYQGGMWPLVCDHGGVVRHSDLSCSKCSVLSSHQTTLQQSQIRHNETSAYPLLRLLSPTDSLVCRYWWWLNFKSISVRKHHKHSDSDFYSLFAVYFHLAWCLFNLSLNKFEFAFGQLVLEQFLQINSPDMRHSIKIVNVWVNNGMR